MVIIFFIDFNDNNYKLSRISWVNDESLYLSFNILYIFLNRLFLLICSV